MASGVPPGRERPTTASPGYAPHDLHRLQDRRPEARPWGSSRASAIRATSTPGGTSPARCEGHLASGWPARPTRTGATRSRPTSRRRGSVRRSSCARSPRPPRVVPERISRRRASPPAPRWEVWPEGEGGCRGRRPATGAALTARCECDFPSRASAAAAMTAAAQPHASPVQALPGGPPALRPPVDWQASSPGPPPGHGAPGVVVVGSTTYRCDSLRSEIAQELHPAARAGAVRSAGSSPPEERASSADEEAPVRSRTPRSATRPHRAGHKVPRPALSTAVPGWSAAPGLWRRPTDAEAHTTPDSPDQEQELDLQRRRSRPALGIPPVRRPWPYRGEHPRAGQNKARKPRAFAMSKVSMA